MRKHLLALVAMICMCGTVATAADKRVSAGDKNQITFTGRVQHLQDGSVRYDWTGVYMQTRFTGSRIAAVLSDEGTSYHNVFVDGKWIKKIKVSGKDPQSITLADKLAKGTHTLRLQKCTEGEYGCTTVKELIVDKNATLTAVKPKARFIEVIGDSYTCGFGTESNNRTDPFKLETENCNQAYGCLVANYFDADYALVAHSGQGITRHYGDSVRVSVNNMPDRWMRIFDDHGMEPYDFKAYTPDLVMINLGTNDFSPTAIPTSEQFVGAYVKLIKNIKAHYGEDTPVLCITAHSASTYLKAAMAELAKETLKMKKVYMANPMDRVVNTETELGACWHPSFKGQCKIAMSVIPQVSTIMGWSVEGKPLPRAAREEQF